MHPEEDDFTITMAVKRYSQMTFKLQGLTARTALRLFDAGKYGCHQSVNPRDCLARLEQAGIQFTCYSAPRRGTNNGEVWTRLGDQPEYVVTSINGRSVH